MGYKLAGYEVLGGVEIDPEMMAVYKANHNPKYSYLMGVQEFKKIPDRDLPAELFSLDILDGSPPCSSFSMAGAREKKWGKASKFREGQAVQNLDDLFFDFIDVAAKLKPKVVVAENVKGLIQGNARGYVKQIFKNFDLAGYNTQLFLLNAAAMGVPQKRERTFFIATRKDLNLPKIILVFNEAIIPFLTIDQGKEGKRKPVGIAIKGAAKWCLNNRTSEIVDWCKAIKNKESFFTQKMALPWEPLKTQCASGRLIYPGEDFFLSDLEVIRGQTFPDDFNPVKSDIGYLCGMSVPPFMTQRVALQIEKQLLRSSHGPT